MHAGFLLSVTTNVIANCKKAERRQKKAHVGRLILDM